MSAIDFMLGLAGVPSELITEVEKVAPNAAALLKLAQDNAALLDEIRATATKAAPLIAKAMPLMNAAAVEINVIMPAAQDVIAFIQKMTPDPSHPAPGSQF